MRAGTYLLLTLAFFVVVFSKIPTIAAYKLTPGGFQWTGILSRNTADLNSYLSIVEETRHSSLRAKNLYSAEPHKPFQVRPLHNLMGLTGRVFPGISSLTLLNLTGILTSLALAAILILLTMRIFNETFERVICFLILSVGSGLGWIHLVPDPPDLRIVETSTFLTFLSPPLYQTSLSLFLSIFLLLDRSWNAKTRSSALKWSILAGVCGIWLGLERPFSLAPILIATSSVLILHSIRNRKPFLSGFVRVLPLLAGIGFALGYQLLLMRTVPVYASWNRQHVLPTPEPLRLLSSLGLLLPLGFLGVRPLIKRVPILGSLFLLYIPASIVFSYLPFPYQERFLEGLPVSVAIFAATGLIRILRGLRNNTFRTAVAVITIALLIPSSFFGLSSDLKALAHQSPPQYLPQRLIQAMRKLQEVAKPDEAVLSSQAIGNFIPAYAARPVVIGHNVATANIQEKKALVNRLFRTQADTPDAAKLFRLSKAAWLFWSPEEKIIAHRRFNPAQAPYLKLEFSNGLVDIYQFKNTN